MSFAGIPDNDEWADCRHCGSPCGGRCVFSHGPRPPTINNNHLPAELAAQMFEREGSEASLDEADRELVTILAEECAEVVQRCTKILRFGLRVNPWTGRHNRATLESELGDIQAIATLLMHRAVIRSEYVSAAAACKLVALARPDGRLRAAHAVAVDFQNTTASPPGKYDERDE